MAASCQFDDIGVSRLKITLTLILYFLRDRREPGDNAGMSAAAPVGRLQRKEVRVKGFLERLQWKLSGMMQGRRGADTLSNFLVVVGIVLLLASIVPGLDLLSWVALIVLAYSLFRSYSKNIAARDRENAAFERIVEKPRKQLSLMRKQWTNRKTTRYFKCKGCGQVLSVPRGKGTLRVVCPKCKTETKQKS